MYRQEVVFGTVKENLRAYAEDVCETLGDALIVSAYVRPEMKGQDFELVFNVDPEEGYSEALKIIRELKKYLEPKGADIKEYKDLVYEPSHVDCRLCGERYPSDASGCPVCHCPPYGDAHE